MRCFGLHIIETYFFVGDTSVEVVGSLGSWVDGPLPEWRANCHEQANDHLVWNPWGFVHPAEDLVWTERGIVVVRMPWDAPEDI